MPDHPRPVPVHPAGRAAAVAAAAVLAVLLAYVIGTGHGSPAQASPVAPSAVGPPAPAAPSAAGSSGVEVVGTGRVAGTPDVLRLDLGVEAKRSEAGSALSAVSGASAKVINALRARGVASRDVKTTGLSLQPNYDYPEGGAVLRGYVAAQEISATLRDLRTAGGAISAAVAAGGDAARVQGVVLDLEGDSALLAQARTAAIADARTKALSYARATGRSLGAVTVVSESTDQGAPIPLPSYSGADSAARGVAPVPVQPGSQQVSVRVRVVWSFG